MESELSYLVTYPCPRCGVELEAYTDDWQDWRKCPSCGRPGRPPLRRRIAQVADPDVMYIGTFTTGPHALYGKGSSAVEALYGPPRASYPSMEGYSPRPNALKRLLFGGGFFLATFLALVSVAQQVPLQAGVFGFSALILLVLLAQSSRRA